MKIQEIGSLLPAQYRGPLGLYLSKNLTRIPLLGIPLVRIMWQLPSIDRCGTDLDIKGVLMPRDNLPAYINVYVDRIYDHYGTPQKGNVVIDIGAAAGSWTVKAAELVGSEGKVIAVEPSPDMLPYLHRNVDRRSNVTIVGAALSTYDREEKFFLSGMHGGFTAYKTSKTAVVTTTSLDSLVKKLGLRRVDYIKTNTAFTMNLEILRGATETLKSQHPHLVVYAPYELQGRRQGLNEIKKLLRDLGYQYVLPKGICIFAL